MKRSESEKKFNTINRLFSQENDFCEFGFVYSNLIDSAPLADRLKKTDLVNKDNICAKLKEGAASENHYTNQLKQGKITEAIVNI